MRVFSLINNKIIRDSEINGLKNRQYKRLEIRQTVCNLTKILTLLFFLLLPVNLWAACSWNGNTGTAASCTTTEIDYCVSDASSKTGEIAINLPSCSTTWSSGLTINMTSGFVSVTKLTIMGAGTPPTIGSAGLTVLNNGSFSITSSPNKKWRISNVKLTGGGGFSTNGSTDPATGGGFRIDHID